MINVNDAWSIFLQKAQSYYNTQEIFCSLTENRRYNINDVQEDYVGIKRLDTPAGTITELTLRRFTTIINRINNGITKKRDVYPNVPFIAAVVLFLPMLEWDEDGANIILNPSELGEHYFNIDEAADDNINDKILRSIRLRRGQNKLRLNLFQAYDGQCCITGCSIKEILHACHINPHSESGDNTLSNAFLLRSDIHDLFDSHMLGVNPETLRVQVNFKLVNSEYKGLNDQLIKRNENITLNAEALACRWQLFKSKNVQ